MNVFLDSSALVKRYIEEGGSAELDRHLEMASAVGVSVLAPIEAASAFSRLRRESRISSRHHASLREALAHDVRDVTLVALNEDVIATAIDTVERHPLRGADAVHVASAIAWSADVFISADQSQLKAARARGLAVASLATR